MRRLFCAVVAVAAVGAGATASSAPAATTTAHAQAAPPTGPLDVTRLAKIGLAEFILNHVDRPLVVVAGCPTVPAETAAQLIAAVGLVPSRRDYGPAIVFDPAVGSGLAAVRCGNDLARGPEPSGAVSVAVDVAMLDGQASFAQLAVVLGGRDVVVTDVAANPALSQLAHTTAQQAARCTNGGRDCTAAVAVDGLAVIVRLRGLPAETGETIARRLSLDATPGIVTNLAALTREHD